MIRKTTLIAAILLMAASQTFAKEINVRDMGAIPGDGKDDTKALREAAAICRKNPGTTLIIPPGSYILRDDSAVKLEIDALAGKFGVNPERVIFTPYYPYSKGLDFSGSVDATVIAYGATLMCEGWMEPISICDSRNFTLRGLTIDYLRKPFSRGEVIAVTPKYYDVRFTNERIITDQTPMMRMTFWNHKYNRVDPATLYYPEREILANNVVRFHNSIPDSLVGSTANVNHCFHFRPAVFILNSQNTTLDQLTIHSQPGMGIVGFDSKDIVIKQLAIRPAAGYSQSTNTDATHFAACEGLLRFEACYFEGQGDDATNVHGYYQTINSVENGKATLEVKAVTYTHSQTIDAPRVGDQMELVEIKTLKPIKTLTVTEVEVVKPKLTTSRVVLSEPLPEDFENYYLMNITKLPRLEFVNSVINSHLARGILVKTRGVMIKGNTFRHCTGTAIHIGAESGWHEGTHSKDVVVADNMIMGCGSGSGGQGGASGIAVIIEAKDTQSSYLHDNITIRGNMVIGDGNACGIYVGNAKNVILEDNSVTNCKTDVITNSTQNLVISR